MFVVENGKAIRREVEIGHRSQFDAEVLKGIEEGAQVVLHPTNQISDGRMQATIYTFDSFFA